MKVNRPTIVDVARYSGVSYQTVSRVINKHPHVSSEARERVLEAIRVLGYQPNKAAAKLASKTSDSIAVITYGSGYYGPTQMSLSIEHAAKARGFDVIFTNVSNTGQELIDALHHISGWQVGGILIIVPVEGLAFEEAQQACPNITIVQIDAQRNPNIPSVVIDDVSGTEQVTKHLISLGHRRIATIAGPQAWFSAQLRLKALKDSLAKIDTAPVHIIEGDWSPTSGYNAMRELIASGADFTALVAANDQMALGALRALHEVGLRVPQDVAVVGFDDIPEAAFFEPPLTTVRQDFIGLGSAGFNYLLQRIENPQSPKQQQLVQPQLILRQTTLPVAP